MKMRKFTESEEYYLKSLEYYKSINGENNIDIIHILEDLGDMYLEFKEYSKSDHYYKHVLV